MGEQVFSSPYHAVVRASSYVGPRDTGSGLEELTCKFYVILIY